ncbi:hypothetical protein WSM22_23870 [Cytophagales bacterium WSM2-2]|nr:hypothetical protein WSM22_23870 [Cytophagales bacterium WSM2-2]
MAQLTVIMPVYNASAFIEEAVRSILDQTFRDFELWIVDDASTDDSIAVVKLINDPRIKFFANSSNLGRVRTVNGLVREISSPYFTITDADDVSYPQRFEKQISFLKSNSDYAMCGTSYWAIDEKGFLVRKMKLLEDVSELRAAALHESQFLGPSTMMRKSVIDHFPEFYRIYFIRNHADADLSCMILDRFNSTNLAEPLYFYRILKSSVTRRKVTVHNLNIYKLIGHLSGQRRKQGQDCLQRGDLKEADEFMEAIQHSYDQHPSFFYRHQAFFHLYWGLTDLAWQNAWKAFFMNPFSKNFFALGFVIFRIVVFLLRPKRHYSSLIKK